MMKRNTCRITMLKKHNTLGCIRSLKKSDKLILRSFLNTKQTFYRHWKK